MRRFKAATSPSACNVQDQKLSHLVFIKSGFVYKMSQQILAKNLKKSSKFVDILAKHFNLTQNFDPKFEIFGNFEISTSFLKLVGHTLHVSDFTSKKKLKNLLVYIFSPIDFHSEFSLQIFGLLLELLTLLLGRPHLLLEDVQDVGALHVGRHDCSRQAQTGNHKYKRERVNR